jgi:hypothetical protein
VPTIGCRSGPRPTPTCQQWRWRVTVSDGTVVNIDTTAAVVAFCGSPGDGEASQLAALTGDYHGASSIGLKIVLSLQ